MRELETGNPEIYFCPRTGFDYDDGHFNMNVTESQIGDGIQDCQFGLDETCGWKSKLQFWRDPTKFNVDYVEYMEFLGELSSKPRFATWFTMATPEVKELGHEFEVSSMSVSFFAIFFFILTDIAQIRVKDKSVV